MAHTAIGSNKFNVAEEHCQKCLSYSKGLELEGVQKTNLIFSALHLYVKLREYQANYSSAVLFAEEVYNLVLEAYDCVHPKVQEGASRLINCLIW
jgi:hypothetical protein